MLSFDTDAPTLHTTPASSLSVPLLPLLLPPPPPPPLVVLVPVVATLEDNVGSYDSTISPSSNPGKYVSWGAATWVRFNAAASPVTHLCYYRQARRCGFRGKRPNGDRGTRADGVGGWVGGKVQCGCILAVAVMYHAYPDGGFWRKNKKTELRRRWRWRRGVGGWEGLLRTSGKNNESASVKRLCYCGRGYACGCLIACSLVGMAAATTVLAAAATAARYTTAEKALIFSSAPRMCT